MSYRHEKTEKTDFGRTNTVATHMLDLEGLLEIVKKDLTKNWTAKRRATTKVTLQPLYYDIDMPEEPRVPLLAAELVRNKVTHGVFAGVQATLSR
jgi:hypothetical protein